MILVLRSSRYRLYRCMHRKILVSYELTIQVGTLQSPASCSQNMLPLVHPLRSSPPPSRPLSEHNTETKQHSLPHSCSQSSLNYDEHSSESSCSIQSHAQPTVATPPSQAPYQPRKRPTQCGIIRSSTCASASVCDTIPDAIRHMTCAAAEQLVGCANATVAQALHRLSLLDSVPRRRGRPSKSDVDQRQRLHRLRAELHEQVHALRVKHDALGCDATTPPPPPPPPNTCVKTWDASSESRIQQQHAVVHDEHDSSACKTMDSAASSERAVACKRKQPTECKEQAGAVGTQNNKSVSVGASDDDRRGLKRNADGSAVRQHAKQRDDGAADNGHTGADDKQAVIESLQGEIREVRQLVQRESKRANELEEALNVEVQVHASDRAEQEIVREKVKELERSVAEREDEIREKDAAVKGLMAQVKELEKRRCERCAGQHSGGGHETTREQQVDALKRYAETVNARLKRVLQRNRRLQQKLYQLAARHGCVHDGDVK